MIDDLNDVKNALEMLKQDESEKDANESIENVENEVAKTIDNLPDTTASEASQQHLSEFGNAMDKVKLNVLAEASVEDEKFVDKVKQTLKSAAVKHTEVEEKKADFEKQKVDYASEVLSTAQQQNEHKAIEDKWANREHKRIYHYNGVKPIMNFVGITEPLNLFLLYLLTTILSPFFLLSKLLKGTVGAIIAGASNEDRPKAIKGFLWTLIAIVAVLLIAAVIYLFLKWQGLIYIK